MSRERRDPYTTDNDLRTDGGHTPPNMRIADRGWPDDAVDNKLRWGQQPPIDLTLALIEEVGELADELLQSGRFESAEAKHARVCLSAARDAGFATRSFLESFFEDEDGEPLPIGDRPELGDGIDAEAVLEELDDLAPLCYQLAWALDKPDELVTDGGQTTGEMERITFRCPEPMAERLEEEVDAGRFPNRSEALRTAVRELLDRSDVRGYTPTSTASNHPGGPRTDGGISISREELERRIHYRSTTPAEQRKRCPECGSTHVQLKTGKWGTADLDRGRWYCKDRDCLAHFDRPVQEEKRV